MSRPTHIVQPGPALEPRVVAVEARGRAFEIELRAGDKLLAATARGFAAEGFSSGVVALGPLALGPFAYVMPALSKTGENAAFYSAIFRPAGVTRLEGGAMTFGTRDSAPFFHTHALWREADGNRSGGHILPEETVVADTARVFAFGLDGAAFDARHDPETNFKVFGPVSAPSSKSRPGSRAIAIRMRPNQDLFTAIETTAQAFGIRNAVIRGGVGSTIGAALEDGTVVENFATEVFIKSGQVACAADGNLRVELDIGLVDYSGQLASGRLLRGHNPVLMTFELVLDVLA